MRRIVKKAISILLVATVLLSNNRIIQAAEEEGGTEKQTETEFSGDMDSGEDEFESVLTEIADTENNSDEESAENSNDKQIFSEIGVDSSTEYPVEEFTGVDMRKMENGTSEEVFSWAAWKRQNCPNYESLDKREKVAAWDDYNVYLLLNKQETTSQNAEKSIDSGSISNAFLKVYFTESGRFSIGNVEGNPNYSTDNGERLLYGFPDGSTSQTLIKVDTDEYFFSADSITYAADSAVAVMNITEHNITIMQRVSFCRSGNVDYADSVRISYNVVNRGTDVVNVGVRIMLDTMLANNDDAPFKVTGTGNITEIRTYEGNAIPSSYQVYDDLISPTTIATGFLKRDGERKPDKVQFTHWGSIEGSSWDYVADEGGYLGDSAVGVYFDPIALTAGGSTEVSTYYGVGVGGTIASADNTAVNLKSDQIALIVKETGTSNRLEGVEVSVRIGNNTLQGTTAENGQVILSSVPTSDTQAAITIEKEGYRTRTVQIVIKGGSATSLSMKSNNDTTPIIESVTLDGADVLNGMVHYIQDHDDIIEKTAKNNVRKIALVASADMDDCVYYLMQDQSVVDSNDTGKFELNAVSTTGGTLVSKFKSGTRKYIRCVSRDGKKSDDIPLGIKVSLPTASGTDITDLDLWPYGQTNVATGTIGMLLLGDSVKFGLGEKLKVKISVDENGKVKAGLNLKTLPDNGKDRDDIFKALSKGKMNKALKNKFQNQQTKISMGAVETDVDIFGYGEGIIKDGKAIIDLGISLTGSVKASYTTNYFYVVPLYITVGANGEIKAEAKFNIKNETGWQFGVISGTISPAITLSVEGGVGSKGVANLGVEGAGKLEYEHNFVSKQSNATLTGTATVVFAVWKFEKRLKLAEKTIKIYDSNDKEGTVYASDEVNIGKELGEQEFVLKDTGYLNQNESREGVSAADGDYIIEESTDAAPQIVKVGNKKYKFWLSENSDRTEVSNNNVLVYSVYEDGGWGAVHAVADDGTGDYDASVCVSGDKIYIAWQDSKETFSDDTVTVEDMAQNAEIKYAVLDTVTDMVSAVTNVTDNEAMDVIPSIIAVDEKVYIAWYSTAANIFASEETPEGFLMYQCVSSDEEAVKISLGTRDVSQISTAVVSGKAVAYVTLSDEEVTVDNMQEVKNKVYSYDMSQTATNGTDVGSDIGVFVVSSLNGAAANYWYEDGNVKYSVDGAAAKTVFTEGENVGALKKGFAVADSGTETTLYWTAASESGEYQVWAIVYDGEKWNTPYMVTSVVCDSMKDLSATVNSGTTTLSYVAVDYDEDGNVESSIMAEQDIRECYDAALGEIDFDADLVEAGETLPLTLTLENKGNTAIDSVKVEIDGTDYSETKSVTIAPNEEQDLLIDDFKVPDSLDGVEEYMVRVSADADINMDNGFSAIKLGYARVGLTQGKAAFIDGSEYYQLMLQNTGKIDARGVQVKILADETDGTIIYDNVVDELKAGESENLYISATNFASCSKAYSFLYAETELDNEGGEYQLLSTSDETVFLTNGVEVTVLADEGGTVKFISEDGTQSDMTSGIYASYESVKIEALADGGYAFAGWETETGYVEDDMAEETTYVTPYSGKDTLKAVFVRNEESTSISISDVELNLDQGETRQLVVTTAPAANGKRITWETSDCSVVTVDKHGNVTAVGVGTATITASTKDNSRLAAACKITVNEVSVESIRMVYPNWELQGVGATDTLDIIVKPSAAEENVIWNSDNESVVKVDQSGNITAMALGHATITVSNGDGTITAACLVEVKSPLQSISLTKREISVGRNGEETTQVVYDPVDTTDDKTVTWVNYSDDVVSINTYGDYNEKITVKGLKCGTALVAAYVGELVSYVSINVFVPITGITMEETRSLSQGEYAQISWDVQPYDATEKLSWSSSNSEIVSVSSDGYITGENVGTAVITATAPNGIAKKCTVTVTEKKYDITNVTGPFSSQHPYGNNMDKVWQYVSENAKSITITFSSGSELENGCDYIYVMDGKNQVIKSYTGTEMAGATVTIPGSVVRIRMETDGSVTKYGFVVSNIRPVYEFSPQIISVDAIANQTYTGSAITPNITVRTGNKILVNGLDYSVSYSNNVHIGVATVTISAIAPSTGFVTAQFAITMPQLTKLANLKQKAATTKSVTIAWKSQEGAQGYYVYRYDKKSKKYVLYKTLKGVNNTSITIKGLKAKTKYKYAVAAFCNDGNNKASGSRTAITVATASKTPSLKSVKVSGKTISVKWSKVSGVSGYEVAVSKKKNGGYSVKAKTKASVKSAKIKGLKKGKTYYVKVRTYVKSSSGKVYSQYSKAKKVTLK